MLPSKKFYPTRIRLNHRQLKHFVSAPTPNLLYYVNDREVFELNVATNEQRLIANIRFQARCLAAGCGWVCIGGENNGDFAAIDLHRDDRPSDVDSRLPLDLGLSNATSSALERLLASANDLHRLPEVKQDKKVGNDIVNGITIHRMQDHNEHDKEEVFAVLSNNDKTVRMFSLTKYEERHVLEFNTEMNHASISPDGQTLVAVGDLPLAFFYKRVKPDQARKFSARGAPLEDQWEFLEMVKLHAIRNHLDPHLGDGYFTTAWSPSSRLCAVASEAGYITVFDVDLLRSKDWDYVEDSILKIIPSSRPNTIQGAVRTMSFAPRPLDLLVWTENHERVGVADLRTGLSTRQTIELRRDMQELEKIEITTRDSIDDSQDLLREADFQSSFLRAIGESNNSAAYNLATEYIESASEARRRRREAGLPAYDDDPMELSAEERRYLSLLGRERENQSSAAPDTAATRYVQVRGSRSFVPWADPDEFPPLSSARNTQRSTPSEPLSTVEELRNYMRDRHRTAEPTSGESREARRSTSLVMPSELSGSRTAGNDRDIINALSIPSSLSADRNISPSPGSHTNRTSTQAQSEVGRPRTAGLQAAQDSSAPSGQSRTGLSEEESRRRRQREQILESRLFRAAQQQVANHPRRQGEPRTAAQILASRTLPPSIATAGPGARANLSADGDSSAEDGDASSARRELRRQRQQNFEIEQTLHRAAQRTIQRETWRMEASALDRHDDALLQLTRTSLTRPDYMSPGLLTAGVALSSDGRRIFVGTTEGIFELEVNVRERKMRPAIRLR